MERTEKRYCNYSGFFLSDCEPKLRKLASQTKMYPLFNHVTQRHESKDK